MTNRFSKPVAFNRTKEEDQKILKHVSRKNFSGYVKKLILADMERVTPEHKQVVTKKKEPIKLSVAERLKQAQPKVFTPRGN